MFQYETVLRRLIEARPLLESTILVVDDDPDVLLAAEIVLKKDFRIVATETDPAALPARLAEQSFDVLLLDMNFTAGMTSGQEGLHWLNTVKRIAPDTKVILMTAYGAVDTAVKAIKEGASDFVVKPWDNDRLIATVGATTRFSQAAREVRTLSSVRKVLDEDSSQPHRELIGCSEAMSRILARIDKVAGTDASVLILGENGTGKELIARAIHRASKRAGHGFVHVDLGAIAEPLFESELFGHKKGAFTDAKEERAGRFEVASGGTLFLDEIGNLSLQMQAKLLGVLQSQTVSRVGSDRPIPVDVRVVSATNVPPSELADGQQFRQDLLYRINTVEIELPPLRRRPDDIAPLVKYYRTQFAKKYQKDIAELEPDVLTALERYHWPGNVRELVHAVERAVIMSEHGRLRTEDLVLQNRASIIEDPVDLNLEHLEARAIEQAIAKHGGNLTRAAQELGLGRTTLYRKMAKHGL
jgi:two-component system response regulator HydG